MKLGRNIDVPDTKTNENLVRLFNCLSKNVSFEDNIEGVIVKDLVASHNRELVIEHNLGRTAREMVILRSENPYDVYISSSTENQLKLILGLPRGVVLTSDDPGSSKGLYLTNAFGFKSGDKVIGEGIESTVVSAIGNKLLLSSALAFTESKTEIYVTKTTIDVFIL